jgi:acyl CoA:acetate/3-ketoacid CoA transferase beta subunit
MFRYWLQGGRITIGFLGAAQLHQSGQIPPTVIGDYPRPNTRPPGAGGAPEIATSAQQIYITKAQSRRGMVEKIDFMTTVGHGDGGDYRQRLGWSHRDVRMVRQVRHGPSRPPGPTAEPSIWMVRPAAPGGRGEWPGS